jgi:hypothetical protein
LDSKDLLCFKSCSGKGFQGILGLSWNNSSTEMTGAGEKYSMVIFWYTPLLGSIAFRYYNVEQLLQLLLLVT